MAEKFAWKQFEELVAQIEKVLQPIGAVVTSPDKVPDLVAGISREVDATIRIPGGDWISVECRDRASKRRRAKQDVCWIEQLVTKRADIGASRTIGVSAGGFTAAAIAKAKHYGIALRQLSQITDAQIAQDWVGGLQISVISVEFVLTDVAIVDENLKTILLSDLPENTASAFRLNGTSTPFLKKKGVLAPVSAQDIFNSRVPAHEWLSRDGEFPLTIGVTSGGDEWSVITATGERVIRKMALSFLVQKIETRSDIKSVRRYSDMSEPILDQIDSVTQLGDIEISMTVSGRQFKPFPDQR